MHLAQCFWGGGSSGSRVEVRAARQELTPCPGIVLPGQCAGARRIVPRCTGDEMKRFQVCGTHIPGIIDG